MPCFHADHRSSILACLYYYCKLEISDFLINKLEEGMFVGFGRGAYELGQNFKVSEIGLLALGKISGCKEATLYFHLKKK
jgi:hypothetical protein